MTGSPESEIKVKSGAGSPSVTKRGSSRRAVGLVRVSRVGGREGESFVSPAEQAQRIADACARDGLKLVDTFEESDVSGGASLAQRPGLSEALQLIEDGGAEVLVVAHFDRLVRSLARQAEILERVEKAGGQILVVDVGEVSVDTASRWLSSTMLGMVAEYHRRVTKERTQDAKRRAIARGVPTFANVPPGYRLKREEDERGRPHTVGIEVDAKEARAVRRAFEMRADGATVMDVRAYLRAQGIERSFHGVQALLSSRMYLGELRFGDLVNDDPEKGAPPAIVDPVTWQAVQKMRSVRGRRPKSDRLLARLGVLRCGTCGARMVVGSSREGYSFYRCNPTSDCPRRVTVSADVAERTVVAEVKTLLRGVAGTASVAEGIAEAGREYERWEDELDAAVRAFSGLDDVAAARERLLELRGTRDRARLRLDELQVAAGPALRITATDDWDSLTLDARRALIRAVIERADVVPGRGEGRITVKPRVE